MLTMLRSLRAPSAAEDLTTKKGPLFGGHDFVPRFLISFERPFSSGTPWRRIEAGIVDEAMRWSPVASRRSTPLRAQRGCYGCREMPLEGERSGQTGSRRDVEQRDSCPLSGQASRIGEAKLAQAPGDDNDFILERKERTHSVRSFALGRRRGGTR